MTTTREQLFADLEKDGISNTDNRITKAKNGDGDTMVDIGFEYNFNKRKYDKAMAWYQLAADKNNSEAQRMIGNLYFYGQGVLLDYSLAMEWWLKAAIQNDKKACVNIGWLFERGHGVPVDKYKALEWYYKEREDSALVKRLTNQEIQLKQQDKNKSIEQLIIETEDIAWPGGRTIKEKLLKNEMDRLKQRMNKMEEDSKAKDSRIKSLQEELQTFRAITEHKKQEINSLIESIDQLKQKEQTVNNELQALKQANHTLMLKMEAKDNKVASLEKEIKLLQITSENSSQGTNKRVEELERSIQIFEQERQLKDGQIALMKEKMEISLEKEKQKRNEVERKYRAIKKELKNMKAPTQKRISPEQVSTESKKDENNSTNSSDNETDYDTEHDSAGSDNNDINYDSAGSSSNDINYDTPSEEDDGDNNDDYEKNANDLNYDSDEQSKNRKKIPSIQSACGSRKWI